MSGDDTIRRNLQDDPAEDDFAEDQFYDDGEVTDQESAGLDEDWESYDPEFSEDGEEAEGKPAKKKMPMFNIIVIGGAVVLGLGVMYMKMGGAPPAQNTQTAQTETPALQPGGAPPTGPITTAVAPQAPEQPVKKPGGFLNDQDALSQLPSTIENANQAAAEAGVPMAATTDQPPMPAPIGAAEQEPVSQGDELTPLPPPVSPAGTSVLQASNVTAGEPEQSDALPPAMPQAAQAPVSDPFADGAPASPVGQSASAGQAASSDASVIGGVSDRLDKLMQRMDALEMKISNLQSAQGGQEMQSLQNSLEQIGSRLSALEKNKEAAGSAAKKAPPVENEPEEPAVKKSRAEAPRVKTESKQSSQWVLKSAQPGQAYVSRPGQDDLLSVHVGDKLTGIGTVQSIAVQGGRWVISGTGGSVTQ